MLYPFLYKKAISFCSVFQSQTAGSYCLAAKVDIINKSGAWYNYKGNKIGQGRENSKRYLTEHPEILAEVDRAVREHYGLDPAGAFVAPVPAEAEE